jgi:tetratricopeptide (TPR) repeat protein
VLFEAGRFASAARIWDSIAGNPNPILLPSGLGRRQLYLHVLKAEAAVAAGDSAGAVRAAEAAASWAERTGNPRDGRVALHARSLVMLGNGDTAAAVTALKTAIFSPTVGFTRSNLVLGRILLAQGKAEEALRWISPALRGTLEAANLYVTRTELHEAMAEAHAALGRRDSAQKHWRQVAAALARSDPGARPRLERARAELLR